MGEPRFFHAATYLQLTQAIEFGLARRQSLPPEDRDIDGGAADPVVGCSWTPLMLAAMAGDRAAVKLLIAGGANTRGPIDPLTVTLYGESI